MFLKSQKNFQDVSLTADTRNLPEVIGKLACKADNLIAICESVV
jgi:hypothetical protein